MYKRLRVSKRMWKNQEDWVSLRAFTWWSRQSQRRVIPWKVSGGSHVRLKSWLLRMRSTDRDKIPSCQSHASLHQWVGVVSFLRCEVSHVTGYVWALSTKIGCIISDFCRMEEDFLILNYREISYPYMSVPLSIYIDSLESSFEVYGTRTSTCGKGFCIEGGTIARSLPSSITDDRIRAIPHRDPYGRTRTAHIIKVSTNSIRDCIRAIRLERRWKGICGAVSCHTVRIEHEISYNELYDRTHWIRDATARIHSSVTSETSPCRTSSTDSWTVSSRTSYTTTIWTSSAYSIDRTCSDRDTRRMICLKKIPLSRSTSRYKISMSRRSYCHFLTSERSHDFFFCIRYWCGPSIRLWLQKRTSVRKTLRIIDRSIGYADTHNSYEKEYDTRWRRQGRGHTWFLLESFFYFR